MAALLRRLLLKQRPRPPPLRLFSSFHEPLFPDPHLPPFLRQIPSDRPTFFHPITPSPSAGPPPASFRPPLHAFPSFPHCLLSGPAEVPLADGSDAELDDPTEVWADSVKKKRKKKMNKHKYKKLRKRLRHKS